MWFKILVMICKKNDFTSNHWSTATVIQWMIDTVNLTLSECLLNYVGQLIILIDINKWLLIYFHKITLQYRYFTILIFYCIPCASAKGKCARACSIKWTGKCPVLISVTWPVPFSQHWTFSQIASLKNDQCILMAHNISVNLTMFCHSLSLCRFPSRLAIPVRRLCLCVFVRLCL